MKISSPLRYPGGKSAMANLLTKIRRLNGLGSRSMAEPYAGGAGASLTMLYLEEVHKIHINDADPAIHDIWWSLINKSKEFLDLLSSTRVSMAEWRRQRNVYRNTGRVSKLRKGFSAFYLNRCNRSGIIINGGPIGGYSQAGKWKLNARYNKKELLRRCEKITEYRERIRISCRDGIQLIESLDAETTFFFIDPPYYEKGPLLYLNKLNQSYHTTLSDKLKTMQSAAWVLTYDDVLPIRKLYRDWASIRPFSLCYSASGRSVGKEVIITPKWMKLPKHQTSDALFW